jgi:hypothetical protein
MSIKRILRSIQLVKLHLTLPLGNVSWTIHDCMVLHFPCIVRIKASYNTHKTQFSLVFTGQMCHETTDGLTWLPVEKERKGWTVFRHWNSSHINMSSRINIDAISQSQLPAWWTADVCTHSITAERSAYKSIKHSVQFVTSLSVLCPFRSINRRRYCILWSHVLFQNCSEECKETRYCTRAKFYLATMQPCNWYADHLPSCLAY